MKPSEKAWRQTFLAIGTLLVVAGIWLLWSNADDKARLRGVADPPVLAISQVMADICPSEADLDTRIACSARAARIAGVDELRALEVETQLRLRGLATVGIFVSVAGLIITLGALWLLAQTLDETAKASAAAVEAAKAASAANAGFQQATHREQRAYVGIFRASLEKEGDNWRAEIGLRNTGKTPAHNVRYRFMTAPGLENRTSFTGGNDAYTPQGDRAPDAEWLTKFLIEGAALRSISDFQAANPGAASIYIYMWGELVYEDTFGIERTTAFRLRKSIAGRLQDGSLTICDTGNAMS